MHFKGEAECRDGADVKRRRTGNPEAEPMSGQWELSQACDGVNASPTQLTCLFTGSP